MSYVPRGKEKLLFFPIPQRSKQLNVVFQETVDGIVYNTIVATLEFREKSRTIIASQICYEYGDIPQKDRLLQLLRETYLGNPCGIYTAISEE